MMNELSMAKQNESKHSW